MRIKCDECGSYKVKEVCLNLPKEKEYTMTSYSQRPRFPSTTLEIRYRRYALTCLICGHRVEYTR